MLRNSLRHGSLLQVSVFLDFTSRLPEKDNSAVREEAVDLGIKVDLGNEGVRDRVEKWHEYKWEDLLRR